MALSRVQYAESTVNAAGVISATLGVNPTAGNYLIALFAQWAGNPTLAAGWQYLAFGINAGQWDFAIAVRQVQAGDTTTVNPFTSGGAKNGRFSVWEVSGGYPMLTHRALAHGATSTTPAASLSNFTPANAGGMAMLIAAVDNSNSAAPATPSGFAVRGANTLLGGTPGSQTIVWDETNVSTSTGIGAITVTWGSGTSSFTDVFVMVFEPAPSTGVIFAQPPVIGATENVTGTKSVALQGTPTPGNLLTVIAIQNGASTAWTTQPGWTLVDSTVATFFHMGIYQRVCQAGDTATLTPLSTNALNTCYLCAFEQAQVATTSPVLTDAFTAGAAANPASVNVTGYVPATPNAMALIAAIANDTAEFPPDAPAGWHTAAISNFGSNVPGSVALYALPHVPTAGGSGNQTITWSGGNAVQSDATLAVIGAPSGGGVAGNAPPNSWGVWGIN